MTCDGATHNGATHNGLTRYLPSSDPVSRQR